jgi:hypothetical protein
MVVYVLEVGVVEHLQIVQHLELVVQVVMDTV